jgi:hypothetical protein
VFKYTALIGILKEFKIMGRGIQTHPIPYPDKQFILSEFPVQGLAKVIRLE